MIAHVGDQREGRIDGIDEKDDFDRLLRRCDNLELSDGPRGLVVEDGEILLGEVDNGLAVFGVDDDVEMELLR